MALVEQVSTKIILLHKIAMEMIILKSVPVTSTAKRIESLPILGKYGN